MADPYAVLGVRRDASAKEIKAAYRRLARQHHPDLNPGDHHAADRFKEIAAAYEVISDPTLRRRYDRTGRQGPGERGASQATADFVRAFGLAVDHMGRLFEQEILPRYIDACFRGSGAALVHRVLRDVERYALLTCLGRPEPTEWARSLAAFVTAQCIIAPRLATVLDDDGRPILGRAFRGVTIARGRIAPVWRLQLFVGSFHHAGHTDPSQLDMAVLHVIARETVRVLESSLAPRLRPLERRELGLPTLSDDAVRAADTRDQVQRWGTLVLLVLLVAALVAAILPGFA